MPAQSSTAMARLVAQDQGEPSHLAAVQSTVAYMLDAFAFNLSDGDIILAGDPYCGGTWGGVLTLVRPFFHGGDLRFLAALRFAVPDLAGDIPGPFQPGAHEIWQEALRVTPVKLAEVRGRTAETCVNISCATAARPPC